MGPLVVATVIGWALMAQSVVDLPDTTSNECRWYRLDSKECTVFDRIMDSSAASALSHRDKLTAEEARSLFDSSLVGMKWDAQLHRHPTAAGIERLTRAGFQRDGIGYPDDGQCVPQDGLRRADGQFEVKSELCIEGKSATDGSSHLPCEVAKRACVPYHRVRSRFKWVCVCQDR